MDPAVLVWSSWLGEPGPKPSLEQGRPQLRLGSRRTCLPPLVCEYSPQAAGEECPEVASQSLGNRSVRGYHSGEVSGSPGASISGAAGERHRSLLAGVRSRAADMGNGQQVPNCAGGRSGETSGRFQHTAPRPAMALALRPWQHAGQPTFSWTGQVFAAPSMWGQSGGAFSKDGEYIKEGMVA